MFTQWKNVGRANRLGLGLAAATLLWACDDANLFEPRVVATPEVVALSAPAEVRSGESLDVRVRAMGELRIDSISVKVRGAFNAEQGIQLATNGLTDVVVDASFEVPATVFDTLAVVTAVAVDAQGNASTVVTDTVRVVDSTPPIVQVSLKQSIVGIGKDLEIQVRALDNVGLMAVGYRISVPDGDTLATELVTVTGSVGDTTFMYTVPENIPLGELTVEGLAVDLEGNLTAETFANPLLVVFIDDVLPTVAILKPRDRATLPVADSAFVEVALMDNGGIETLTVEGVVVRGDKDLGTDVEIERFELKTVELDAATDTTITRFLLPTPDSTSETVDIIATAVDVQGNVAADTAALIVGGPKVEILNIEDGQSVLPGRSLAIRIKAADPQRLVQVQLEVDGAIVDTITVSYNPPVDTVTVDTVIVIPVGSDGDFTLVASARNSLDVRGASSPLQLTIRGETATDTIQPALQVTTDAPGRMELLDQVRLEVTGGDDIQGSGIVTAGYTAYAISPIRGDTLIQSEEVSFAPPRTGTVSQGFGFIPFNVDSLSLPDTLVFEITGYMIDEDGNCAAGVMADTMTTLECQTLPTGEIVSMEFAGQRVVRPVVAGRTVLLPQGGQIMDAVVDTTRRNLLLSNYQRDRVEVFRLPDEEFNPPIKVGSEPWGLSLNRGGDTVIVANSGGTNLSNVWLGDPTGQGAIEDNGRRILTPDVVLFDIERSIDDSGLRRFTITVIPDALPPGFSDRPQFMAVDSTGRILYSTKTVPRAGLSDYGTIRKAFVPMGKTRTEVVLLLDFAVLEDAPDFVAVANIDDINIVLGAVDTLGFQEDDVVFIDHEPGDTVTLTGGPETIENAFADLVGQGSDMIASTGRWNVPSLGFRDTTFVAASGDGGWVVFGEGARDPVGRVVMYEASADRVSRVIEVTDILTNPSEVVRGVGLNQDGSLGVARGFRAYFFSTDLRLQGVADLPSGGSGAALHPLHADYPSLDNLDGTYNPDTHLAFLGTGEGTIEIIDAFHFEQLGRIFIRDVITGPLKAALPFPGDNDGFVCSTEPVFNGTGDMVGNAIDIYADAQGTMPHPAEGGPTDDRCVVLKLYGITSAGGVVVVDVRKGDIVRLFREQAG